MNFLFDNKKLSFGKLKLDVKNKSMTIIVFSLIIVLIFISFKNLREEKSKINSKEYFKNIYLEKELFQNSNNNNDNDNSNSNIRNLLSKVNGLRLDDDKVNKIYLNQQSGGQFSDQESKSKAPLLPGTIVNQTGFSGTTNIFSPTFL